MVSGATYTQVLVSQLALFQALTDDKSGTDRWKPWGNNLEVYWGGVLHT